MDRYKNLKFSDWFINMTDEKIYVYDTSSGDICCFPPGAERLPKSPHMEPGTPAIYYILDQNEADALREQGRPLIDIAVIRSKSHGRHGIEISYFNWGENPEVRIELLRGAYELGAPYQ